MLVLISPAKTLDFSRSLPPHVPTVPVLLEEAAILAGELKKCSREEVAALMNLSESLASLNYQRFQDWSVPFTEDNARAALFAFKGDVYEGISPDGYTPADLAFAQEHLRILSGLYGVLRPLDLIQPYRLEMGTRFANPLGRDLYAYWKTSVTGYLTDLLSQSASPLVLDLASREYSSVVDWKTLPGQVVTPKFLDWKNGKYQVISFYAKKARGHMVDFVIRNRVESTEPLRNFSDAGYAYCEGMSSGTEWVYTRGGDTSGKKKS